MLARRTRKRLAGVTADFRLRLRFDGMSLRSILAVMFVALPLSPAPARENGPSGPAGFRATPSISSPFGRRIDPVHGGPAVHHGIDLPGSSGTPILAAAAGRVRHAGPMGSYGNMVEVDHGNGARTRYAHLSRVRVRAGDIVAMGDRIADMGATGRTTGSHLHFELRINGRAVNPAPYLGTYGKMPALPAARPPLANVPAQPHRSAFSRAVEAAAQMQPAPDALPIGRSTAVSR